MGKLNIVCLLVFCFAFFFVCMKAEEGLDQDAAPCLLCEEEESEKRDNENDEKTKREEKEEEDKSKDNNSSVGFYLSEGMIFKGGFLMTLWGSIFAATASIAWSLWAKLKEMCWTQVEVPDGSVAIFGWLEYKMSKLDEMKDAGATRFRVALQSAVLLKGQQQSRHVRQIGDEEGLCLLWLPQTNRTYRINFQGSWLFINQVEERPSQTTAVGTAALNRRYILSCFGSRRQLIEDFILEAQAEYEEKLKEKTIIWTSATSGNRVYWKQLGSRPTRPIDTVVLPGQVITELIADMEEFMRSEQWYSARGIPYRRGYLLYGPPGTGKTSFVTAAAGHLRVTVCILNVASESLTDESLCQLMSETPKHSIILLEDVDAAFQRGVNRDDGEDDGEESKQEKQGEEEKKSKPTKGRSKGRGGTGATLNGMNDLNRGGKGVTLSGLLNAIDGVAAQEGRMVFMSTNHVDRLDPALVRPGRVDVRHKFGYATRISISRFFVRFCQDMPLSPPPSTLRSSLSSSMDPLEELEEEEEKDRTKRLLQEQGEEFAQMIPEEQYSMAEIQGHLMRFRHNPQDALENVHLLLERNHTSSWEKEKQKE